MVGGRVGKDTRRRLKGKNIELILQNVWKRQTLTEDYKENFLEIFLYYDWFQYEKLRFFNMRRVGIFYDFFSSMNVIVYKLLFLFSQHPKWFIYDLKKCGLLRRFSPPGAKRDAPLALVIVAR